MSSIENFITKLINLTAKSKNLFLLTFLVSTAIIMQGQQVNYTVTVTEVQWFSGGLFGACSDGFAGEEYDARVWAFDNINTVLQGGGCISCDNNGDCNTSPNLEIASGTNTCADEITIRFQGGEHDGNNDNNCNFDGNDDCVCGPSNVATINFLNNGPGCTTFNQLGCNVNNHFANVEICWEYVTPLIQNCPGDINVAGSGAACTATANWTPPTENDICNNCSFTSTHNPGDVFPSGTTTVTYTLDCPDPFIDETCSFDVIVDPTPCCTPSITCPADATFECGDDLTAWLSPTFEACSDAAAVLSNDFVAPDLCGGGPTAVTFTLTAGDGITVLATCSAMITINPAILPTITCPMIADLACDETDAFAPPMADFTNSSVDPNCLLMGMVPGTITATDFTSCGGTITVTYSGNDDCGRPMAAVECIVTVTPDGEDPAFVEPLPMAETLECDDVIPMAATLTATDNCTDPIVVVFDEVDDMGVCPAPRIITRTWTATDECGNEEEHIQVVTINPDTEVPVITCPIDATIVADADCNFDASAAITGEPTATDNCEDVTFTFVDGALEDLDCAATGFAQRFIRTWTATDACGNVGLTCDQVINIEDSDIPTIICPPAGDLTLECGNFSEGDIMAWLDTVSATDGCGTAMITNDYLPGSLGLPCPDGPSQFTLTVTFEAMDECGNMDECTASINVIDTTNPIITCPSAGDLTVECGNFTEGDISAWLITATATDECDDVVDVTNDYVVGSLGSPCADGSSPFSLLVSFTATDECGNLDVCAAAINVIDTQAPIFVEDLPMDEDLVCSDAIPAAITLTAIDDCLDPVVVVFAEVDDMALCPDSRIITRTWTATDDCGNEESYEQVITIGPDTQEPAFVEALPMDQNLTCADAIPAAVILTATDNCTNPIAVIFEEIDDMGMCPAEQIITRTWTVTDDCGNEISHTQTITIVPDTELPVFVGTLPADINLLCSDPIPAAVVLTAIDNCTDPQTVEFFEVDDLGVCPNPRIITRTWVITDDCGNVDNYEQVITIAPDTEAPTAANLPTFNFMCSSEVPEASVDDISEEEDNCSTPTVIFFGEVSDGNTCPETITRTYIVQDECGNTLPIIQQIIVGDDTPPSAGVPDPINITCAVPIPDPDPSIVMMLMDNCPEDISVTWMSDVSDDMICPETITRTYLVIDACNNQIEVEQQIIINDAATPSLVVPRDIFGVEGCDPSAITSANVGLPFSDIDADITAQAASGAIDGLSVSDDCGIGSVTYIDVFNDGNCEKSVSRTFTVTDICGFTNTDFQFIVFDCTLASHGALDIKAVPPGGN